MLLALASVQLFFIGGMVCVCVGGVSRYSGRRVL